ncbi:unnamed protein product [Cylicocyclus nassatus]|uniref:MARVEL domain-containing protein n=1 Tax=Cylicocyclus nassatus TaxID=53992 RepID=A0AA36GMA7_CYLNA|nr:unnamed protein product [Cylicocyclus nassatus]
MTRDGQSIPSHDKPRFESWNLVTPTAALRIFQALFSVCTLALLMSVGSHFSPTYAALATATAASVISPALVLIFAFNLHSITTNIDWILWESIYAGSFGFLFAVNSITMTYSSMRWEYTAWYLGAVTCFLVAIAFLVDLAMLVRLQVKNPCARHSQDSARIHLPKAEIAF